MNENREKSGKLRVAKLVTVSLTTRVIVNHDATETDAYILAIERLHHKLALDGMENMEEIVDDDECPFGTFEEDE